jgi:hypothetical protein
VSAQASSFTFLVTASTLSPLPVARHCVAPAVGPPGLLAAVSKALPRRAYPFFAPTHALEPLHAHQSTPKCFTRKRAPHRAATPTAASFHRHHGPASPPSTPPVAVARPAGHRRPFHDALWEMASPARPTPASPRPSPVFRRWLVTTIPLPRGPGLVTASHPFEGRGQGWPTRQRRMPPPR